MLCDYIMSYLSSAACKTLFLIQNKENVREMHSFNQETPSLSTYVDTDIIHILRAIKAWNLIFAM